MFGLIHIYCGDGKGKTTALLIEHNKMFEQVLAKIKNGGYSLLILDEVIGTK